MHGYSVQESYRFITNSGEQVERRSLVNDVWHRHIYVKVSVFVWRLLRNRLPTKDNHANDISCAIRCDVTETTTHLCEMSHTLWLHVWNWVGLSVVAPCQIRHHFTRFSVMAGMPHGAQSFFKVIWFASVWAIWKERNNRIFQNYSDYSFGFKKLSYIPSYGWKQNRCLLITVIMTDGNTYLVWASINDLSVCFDVAFFSGLL